MVLVAHLPLTKMPKQLLLQNTCTEAVKELITPAMSTTPCMVIPMHSATKDCGTIIFSVLVSNVHDQFFMHVGGSVQLLACNGDYMKARNTLDWSIGYN